MSGILSFPKRFFFRRYIPRFAYTHIFFNSATRHSMLHVQNPFSFFWPSEFLEARAEISLNDAGGQMLGKLQRTIPPFGMLAISIQEILSDLRSTAELGTITVDLVPPKKYEKYLHALNRSDARIASPFWMRFFDDLGSQAYVHSIEADRTQIYGVPRIISRLISNKGSRVAWSSDRTIHLDDGESATAYIVNHSSKRLSCTASWNSPTLGKIKTANFSIPRKGVVLFTVESSGATYLSVDPISTSNAKPYVLVQSASKQFALTHG